MHPWMCCDPERRFNPNVGISLKTVGWYLQDVQQESNTSQEWVVGRLRGPKIPFGFL